MLRLSNLIFIFSVLTQFSYSTDYWLPVQSPTTKWLYRLSFPDSINGWACGDSGTIIHTTNGGTSWQIQNTGGIESMVWAISFPNVRLGWAIAFESYPVFGSRILTTTNGGLSWNSSMFPDTTVELYAINFLDSLTGWTAGSQGKVFHTTDGGLTWIPHPIDSSGCGGLFPIFRLGFYNNIVQHAMGGAIDFVGVTWRSTNFGQSWKSTCVGPEPIYDIFYFDSAHAICSGGDWEYGVTTVTTSDAGTSWFYDTTGFFGKGETIDFRTPAEGWIGAGFSGLLLLTNDSGRTWTSMFSPDTTAVYDLVFTTPYHGIAVGYGGKILKYNTEVIGIENPYRHVPDKFSVSQNFPNPFNQSTNINYRLSIAARVRFRIHDAAGRLVRGFEEGDKLPGTYQFKINEPGLSSGIYFLSVTFQSSESFYSESKKIVLVK